MTHAAATLDGVAQSVTDLGVTVDGLVGVVTKLGENIDDVAESVTVLGTMVGEQIESSKQELKAEISAFRYEFDSFRRETDVRLSNLEGEASATRNDLREIYDRLTALGKRVKSAVVDEKADIKRELDDLKQWARDISAETGFPEPKF
jgi:chromosome segregation ATPase